MLEDGRGRLEERLERRAAESIIRDEATSSAIASRESRVSGAESPPAATQRRSRVSACGVEMIAGHIHEGMAAARAAGSREP